MISRPTAAKFHTTLTFARAAAAPLTAPTMVPRLKKACIMGRSVLPMARSTAAPSTFIITSVALKTKP